MYHTNILFLLFHFSCCYQFYLNFKNYMQIFRINRRILFYASFSIVFTKVWWIGCDDQIVLSIDSIASVESMTKQEKIVPTINDSIYFLNAYQSVISICCFSGFGYGFFRVLHTYTYIKIKLIKKKVKHTNVVLVKYQWCVYIQIVFSVFSLNIYIYIFIKRTETYR